MWIKYLHISMKEEKEKKKKEKRKKFRTGIYKNGSKPEYASWILVGLADNWVPKPKPDRGAAFVSALQSTIALNPAAFVLSPRSTTTTTTTTRPPHFDPSTNQSKP